MPRKYIQSLGSGSLFKVHTKRTDSSPDYFGSIGIPGGEYQIMGFMKDTPNGTKYLRLVIGPPVSDDSDTEGNPHDGAQNQASF